MSVEPESERLQAARAGTPWRRWGPYLSERQWVTVREDYSDSGAWNHLTHDQARSQAYRWGEDGQGNEFAVECPTGSGQQKRQTSQPGRRAS